MNSGSWWWTGSPGVLRFMGSRRVGHDWATELNWKIRNISQAVIRSWIQKKQQTRTFQQENKNRLVCPKEYKPGFTVYIENKLDDFMRILMYNNHNWIIIIFNIWSLFHMWFSHSLSFCHFYEIWSWKFRKHPGFTYRARPGMVVSSLLMEVNILGILAEQTSEHLFLDLPHISHSPILTLFREFLSWSWPVWKVNDQSL